MLYIILKGSSMEEKIVRREFTKMDETQNKERWNKPGSPSPSLPNPPPPPPKKKQERKKRKKSRRKRRVKEAGKENKM